MDASTLSATAASVAAVVAATVARIQLYIGRKQASAALTSAQAALMNATNVGRHMVAEFRQKWIDKVIDTLCEHHSIIMSSPIEHERTAEENKTLLAARTKLAILLNPDEEDTVALLAKITEIAGARTSSEREAKSTEMLAVARPLLKREWVRIKNDLQKTGESPAGGS